MAFSPHTNVKFANGAGFTDYNSIIRKARAAQAENRSISEPRPAPGKISKILATKALEDAQRDFLTEERRKQIVNNFKESMRDYVIAELRTELMEDVRKQLYQDLYNDVREELRNDARITQNAQKIAVEQIKSEVKTSLKESLLTDPRLRKKVVQELREEEHSLGYSSAGGSLSSDFAPSRRESGSSDSIVDCGTAKKPLNISQVASGNETDHPPPVRNKRSLEQTFDEGDNDNRRHRNKKQLTKALLDAAKDKPTATPEDSSTEQSRSELSQDHAEADVEDIHSVDEESGSENPDDYINGEGGFDDDEEEYEDEEFEEEYGDSEAGIEYEGESFDGGFPTKSAPNTGSGAGEVIELISDDE